MRDAGTRSGYGFTGGSAAGRTCDALELEGHESEGSEEWPLLGFLYLRDRPKPSAFSRARRTEAGSSWTRPSREVMAPTTSS